METTWLLLQRDISESLRVDGEDRLVATLALDMGSGMVLTSQCTRDEVTSLSQALRAASASPIGGIPSSPPALILCPPALGGRLARVLGDIGGMESVEVAEVSPPDEAEDAFDSLVSHLAGRTQPDELPSAAESHLLHERAIRFTQERPWERWPDDLPMIVDVTVERSRRSFRALVLGNSGIQHGLVLIPVDHEPQPPDADELGPTLPPGGIAMFLDDDGVPPDLQARAHRYGWPADEALLPVFSSANTDGPGELGRRDAQMLTVALAAAVDHDARSTAEGATGPIVSSGVVELPSGVPARYTVREDDEIELGLDGPGLLLDVLSEGTPIGIEVIPWGAYAVLRSDSRVLRQVFSNPIARTGSGIPVVVIDTQRREGRRVADRLAGLQPLAVQVVVDAGEAMLLMLCNAGFLPLVPFDAADPILRRFRRRLNDLGGAHAIIVADWERVPDASAVFGVFECTLRVMPASPRRRTAARRRRSSKRLP